MTIPKSSFGETGDRSEGYAREAIAPPTPDAGMPAGHAPMTREQADQILAELKSIKQGLIWVLILGGFVAARAFFFHY